MPDNHYENPRLVALYDLDSGWSKDRDFYLNLPEKKGERILDLGCGTGLLCNAYAKNGHEVTGLDPAASMLQAAKSKEYGDKINWVLGNADSYLAEEKFDLIIMTGHAFQVLMEDLEIKNTFTAIKHNIKSGGRVVFESRNPNIDWKKRWDYEITLNLPDCKVRESRRFKSLEGDRLSFELVYEFPDETLVSRSELRFLSLEEITRFSEDAGLRVSTVYGDWDSSCFDKTSSEEMIFVLEPDPET